MKRSINIFITVIGVLFGISLILWFFQVLSFLLKICLILTGVFILLLIASVIIELISGTKISNKDEYQGFIISDKTDKKGM